MSQTATQMTPAKAWVAAARPQTLAVAFAPVLLGTALASQASAIHGGLAIATLFGAIFIQIGTNLFNDYADFRKGADGATRLGPARACAQGWLRPRDVLLAVGISYGLAIACGLYLTMHAGWPIVAIGLAALTCGLAYTGGPWPLAYLGIADLFVFLFFGVIAVSGSYFVQTATVSPAVFLYGAALGGVATAVLAVNNLRDRLGDAQAQKKTLAVRMGQLWMRRYYAFLILGSFIALSMAGWWLGQNIVTLILPMLALPAAIWLVREGFRRDGRDLNDLLKRTAQLELIVAVLASAGVVLS